VAEAEEETRSTRHQRERKAFLPESDMAREFWLLVVVTVVNDEEGLPNEARKTCHTLVAVERWWHQ